MSLKNSMANSGVPLFVDGEADLVAKRDAVLDSWYVNCSFESEGKTLGFEWHQMVTMGPTGAVSQVEFLLMDGTDRVWLDHAVIEPVGDEDGASDVECHVTSSVGTLHGHRQELTLQLKTADGSVDVTLRPRKNVLYNGTTGLLRFGPLDSYQFAFPNMDASGAITMSGQEYRIGPGSTAWLDRQWGTVGNIEALVDGWDQKVAWLWLGMTLGDAGEALSLWDFYLPEIPGRSPAKRHAFATVLGRSGNQTNVVADVVYEETWASDRSENRYASRVHVTVPEIDLDFSLTALLDQPEFVRHEGGAQGCQSLCTVKGTYRGAPFERHVILEMIGNVCGSE